MRKCILCLAMARDFETFRTLVSFERWLLITFRKFLFSQLPPRVYLFFLLSFFLSSFFFGKSFSFSLSLPELRSKRKILARPSSSVLLPVRWRRKKRDRDTEIEKRERERSCTRCISGILRYNPPFLPLAFLFSFFPPLGRMKAVAAGYFRFYPLAPSRHFRAYKTYFIAVTTDRSFSCVQQVRVYVYQRLPVFHTALIKKRKRRKKKKKENDISLINLLLR